MASVRVSGSPHAPIEYPMISSAPVPVSAPGTSSLPAVAVLAESAGSARSSASASSPTGRLIRKIDGHPPPR
ncbi:hypothetical protein IU450_10510 [Nocardia abscessus]|uniref:hypothetical protein n=1 Tax=Nocardia abscessus TaxID=120957 RepID=UPI001893FCF5|nr:hypothetical protein [Nocardia abscessus]MBF6336316.1 hypothetical protein [Nocardia abscessus]